MTRTEAVSLFEQMHPGFFEKPSIRAIAPGRIHEELILNLHAFDAARFPLPEPEGITFGLYTGSMEALRRTVAEVDDGWPRCFGDDDEVYCAFADDKVVSFCLLKDMGTHIVAGKSLRIAGPGCVGTLPAFRKRGIGLKMVLNATEILRSRGYDCSYIHYTGVASWYQKLGYQPLLKWTCNGLLP